MKIKQAVAVLALGLAATGSAHAQAVLNAETNIEKGNYIATRSGHYSLILQNDGNAVMYFNGLNGTRPAGFSTGTDNGQSLRMQMDGNLALYKSNGTWAWNSKTGGRPYNMNYKLVLYENGKLAIIDAGNQNTPIHVFQYADAGGKNGGAMARFPFRKFSPGSGCVDGLTDLKSDGVQATEWATANGGTIGYCNSPY